MRATRPVLLIAAIVSSLAVSTLLVSAPAADAVTYRWKKQTVRYFNASGNKRLDKALEVSADYWNALGLKIRLVKTGSARKADIIGKLRPKSFFPAGAVGLGQLPGSTKASTLDLSKELFATVANQQISVGVVTHELGHNLGLQHLGGCAVMNSTVPGACPGFNPKTNVTQCGPSATDYRALRKLYRKRRAPKYYDCTTMLARHKWLAGPPQIAGPVEWSSDGTTWTGSPGAVPSGSEILVRYAVTDPNPIFSYYGQLRFELFGYASLLSRCISRTAGNATPTAATTCKPVSEGGAIGDEAQILVAKPSERVWLVARYRLDFKQTTVFTGKAYFGTAAPADREPSTAPLTITVD